MKSSIEWSTWQSQLRFVFKADWIRCKLHKEWVPLWLSLSFSSFFSSFISSIIFAIDMKAFLLFLSLSLPLNFKYYNVVWTEVGKWFHSLISPLCRPPFPSICNNFSSFEVESSELSSATILRPELLLDFLLAIPPFGLIFLYFFEVSTTGQLF